MTKDLDRLIRRAAELGEEIRRFAERHDPCERCDPPHDGKPRLRPHTIDGWWQVWSGGICIALLSNEDVEPVVEELRGRLQNATEALRERIEPRTNAARNK